MFLNFKLVVCYDVKLKNMFNVPGTLENILETVNQTADSKKCMASIFLSKVSCN